jgi:N-acetylneuraminic acid mutarotase
MKHLVTSLLLCCIVLQANAQNTQKWQTLSYEQTPPNRSEGGVVALDGKLYLMGGEGGPRAVDCYNPKTNTWTQLATAPVMLHHFQAVTYKHKIYVLSAFYEGNFPNQSTSTNVYIFDPNQNTWSKGGQLAPARRRAAGGAVCYKGKLYLVAGITNGHQSGTNAMLDEYNPKTNTWKALPDAPHIRDHSVATVLNGKLYALGGRNTSYHEPNNFMAFMSKIQPAVDCFDFKTGQWSTLAHPLPLGSGGAGVITAGNKIYYIGGERATETERNRARKNVFVYDPRNHKGWQELDSLAFGRNGVGAAVIGKKIYIAGGSTPQTVTQNGQNKTINNVIIETFDF